MGETATCEVTVTGMTCSACSQAIQRALKSTAGIFSVDVDVLSGSVRVGFSDDFISATQVCSVIESLGFTARLCRISLVSAASSGNSTMHRSSDTKSQDAMLNAYGSAQVSCRIVPTRAETRSSERRGGRSGTNTCEHKIPTEAEGTISTATIQFGFELRNFADLERVKCLLQQLTGVISVVESSSESHAQNHVRSVCVTYNPVHIGARQLLHQMHAEGLSPVVQQHDALETQKNHLIQTKRRFEKTLLVCLLPAICILWLSFKGRSNALPRILLSQVLPGFQMWILLLLLLATPVQFYGGRFFHIAAMKSLKNRHCSMDLLVSLSSTLAYTFSVISTVHSAIVTTRCAALTPDVFSIAYGMKSLMFRESHSPTTLHPASSVRIAAGPSNFYDTCAVLIPILLLGKVLQLRARIRILSQLDSMRKLRTRQACLVLEEADISAHSENQLHSQFHGKNNTECRTRGSAQTRQEIQVDTDLLQIGDVVKVNTREIFPADGTLLEPSLIHVDEHMLSGERDSVAKIRGQRLIGGTENLSPCSALMRVDTVGSCSVLEKLLRLIEAAQHGSRSHGHVAESLISMLLPAALITAMVTTVTWIFIAFGTTDDSPITPLQHIRQLLVTALARNNNDESLNPIAPTGILPTSEQAIFEETPIIASVYSPQFDSIYALSKQEQSLKDQNLALMIIQQLRCIVGDEIVAWDNILFALHFGVAVCCVACPCAIGLAAPAAIAAATGTAAQRGIYFKSKSALETAAKVRTLVLDKTGTITTGKLQVVACALQMDRLRRMVLPALKFHTTQSPFPQILSTRAEQNESSGTELDNYNGGANSSVLAQGVRINRRGSQPVEFGYLGETGDNRSSEPPCCVSSTSAEQHQQTPCDTSHLPTSFTHVTTFSVSPLQVDYRVEPISLSCRENLEVPIPIPDLATSLNDIGNADKRKPVHYNDNGYFEDPTSIIECFLWILNCVEKHSTHAIADGIISCYESWIQGQIEFSCTEVPLRSYSRRHLTPDTYIFDHSTYRPRQKDSAPLQHSSPGEASDLSRKATSKLDCCSGVKLLPRGIAASIPLENNYHLNVHISAYDSRNEDTQDWKGRSIDTDNMTVMQWTQWHEQNVGPVVHLFVYPPQSSRIDNEFEPGNLLENPGFWLGAVALRDEVPEETQLVIRYLQQEMKIETHMCTGDNPRTAELVAGLVGIPQAHVHAQRTPQGKLEILTMLQKTDSPNESAVLSNNRPVLWRLNCLGQKRENICCMVGDGYNDAAALAGADIGVSFGTEATLLVASSDATVRGQNWLEVVNLFSIARQTRRIIIGNIVWAWVFNIITLPMAAGIFYPNVHLNPATAAALMACSCMVVLLNALRLTRFTPMTLADLHRQLQTPYRLPTDAARKTELQGSMGKHPTKRDTLLSRSPLHVTEGHRQKACLSKYLPVSDT